MSLTINLSNIRFPQIALGHILDPRLLKEVGDLNTARVSKFPQLIKLVKSVIIHRHLLQNQLVRKGHLV